MRILVVGGTGFIGTYVVRTLAEQGHAVTVYHRGVHEPDLPPSVRHVRDEGASIPVLSFPAHLLREDYDCAIHMVLLGERDAEAAVRALRGAVGRIVVPSSGDVYAAYGRLRGTEPDDGTPSGLLGEDAPLRTALYPHGRVAHAEWGEMRDYDKILVERAVTGKLELAATVLRLPAVYGPGDPYHRFFPYVKRMADRRPAILIGESVAGWRWTHGFVEDVAAAIALAATAEHASGRTYNVGEESTPTVAERVEALGRAAGWSGRLIVADDERVPPQLRPPFRAVDIAYDTARIRRELGFRESVPYDEGLRRTVSWQRVTSPGSVDVASFDYQAEDRALEGLR